jgi:hypothetical protein
MGYGFFVFVYAGISVERRANTWKRRGKKTGEMPPKRHKDTKIETKLQKTGIETEAG